MLIGAATGIGKSTVALHIAQCLATGQPLFRAFYHKKARKGQPRYPTVKSKVLYLDYELNELARKRRFNASAVDVEDLRFPKHISNFDLDENFSKMRDLVARTKPDVLVIDPLSSTHNFQENTSEIKKAFNHIDRIRFDNNCAAIVIHHASSKVLRDKEGTVHRRYPIEMFRGASHIVDWADCAIALYDTDGKGLPLNPEDNSDESEEPVESTKRLLQAAFAKVRHDKGVKPISLTLDYSDNEIIAT